MRAAPPLARRRSAEYWEDEMENAVKEPKSEDDITAEVVRRFEDTPDPRLRQIMTSLTRHLHAFVKDVELTEEEWYYGVEFLTRTGQLCSDKRQEFILLSDTLGITMVVDLINHRKPGGATESTVFGPFHRVGAPEMPYGGNIAPLDTNGVPALISGRVLDLDGKPIANALLDVWQTGSNGLYDSQDASLTEMHMRGKFRTEAQGRYLIRTTRPVHYPIPDDGPVGQMLRATNRHPWRPAHIHFVVSADRFEPVTTHLFDAEDEYLASDAVFAVKDSLVCKFKQCETADEDASRMGLSAPYLILRHDFVLKPAEAGATNATLQAQQRLASLHA
jgi:protocatechuate 3,4-dioxygenase beta subunit